MLQILEKKVDRRKAQNALMRVLKTTMSRLGPRNMGFPGGNLTTTMYCLGNDRLFYAYFKTDGSSGIERFWNAFGIFDPLANSQDISVEINIAVESPSQQVAAFFARDTETDRVYLFHSGRIGGGREGDGRNTFLAWSKNRLVATYDSDGKPSRLGVLIGPIEDDKIARRIERFVKQVTDFKRSVRAGEIDQKKLQPVAVVIDEYKKEFTGRKSGSFAAPNFDYISMHGEIVDALHSDRDRRKKENEVIANSGYIDLFVKNAGKYVEIYEVKPSLDRQALYTAIGQLVVHGNLVEEPSLNLVVPGDQKMPKDVQEALTKRNIKIINFTKNHKGVYQFNPSE